MTIGYVLGYRGSGQHRVSFKCVDLSVHGNKFNITKIRCVLVVFFAFPHGEN